MKRKLNAVYRDLRSRYDNYSELIGRETSEQSRAYDSGVMHGLAIALWMINRIL